VKPAWSVIFFTTLAGAGQGLLIAIYAGQLLHGHDARFATVGAAVSFALLTAGLVSSFFHLGRPSRPVTAAATANTNASKVVLMKVRLMESPPRRMRS